MMCDIPDRHLIADMLAQLGLQPTLQTRFDQSLNQAILPIEVDLPGIDLRILAYQSWSSASRFQSEAKPLTQTICHRSVWTWFTIRHERNRWQRAATLAAWGLRVVAVTATSFTGGAQGDLPRSRWIRQAATLQAILGIRIALAQITARRSR